MKTKLEKILKPKYLFIVLAVILVVKVLLIIRNDGFLFNYDFLSADSLDWVVNGKFFIDSTETSLRSPGLPIILKVLFSLNALPLIVFINQFAFLAIIYYCYKTVKLYVKSNAVHVIIILTIFVNLNLRLFSNYILADFYAIALITYGIYLLLTKKYILSFLMLGISMLFQNFAFVLIPVFLLFYIYESKILDSVKIKNIAIKVILFLIVFLLPSIPWFLYKFIEFGSPLYSGVEQIGLLKIHFNSIFYFLVNSFSMFGISFFVIVGYFTWKYKKSLEPRVLFLLGGFASVFIFWAILYDWNERRFLLYLIPFLYSLLAIILDQLINKKRWILLTLIITFTIYPTILGREEFFVQNIVPVTPSSYILFNETKGNRLGYTNIAMRPYLKTDNPSIQSIIRGSFRDFVDSSVANNYERSLSVIKTNFDINEKVLCGLEEIDIDTYSTRSVLFLEYNDIFEYSAKSNCD